MTYVCRALARFLALAVVVLPPATAAFAQDEPQLFNAFAIAVASGTIVKSGEKQVMVIGTLECGGLFSMQVEGGQMHRTGLHIEISGHRWRSPYHEPARVPEQAR